MKSTTAAALIVLVAGVAVLAWGTILRAKAPLRPWNRRERVTLDRRDRAASITSFGVAICLAALSKLVWP